MYAGQARDRLKTPFELLHDLFEISSDAHTARRITDVWGLNADFRIPKGILTNAVLII